jgi:hypothetical protein
VKISKNPTIVPQPGYQSSQIVWTDPGAEMCPGVFLCFFLDTSDIINFRILYILNIRRLLWIVEN